MPAIFKVSMFWHLYGNEGTSGLTSKVHRVGDPHVALPQNRLGIAPGIRGGMLLKRCNSRVSIVKKKDNREVVIFSIDIVARESVQKKLHPLAKSAGSFGRRRLDKEFGSIGDAGGFLPVMGRDRVKGEGDVGVQECDCCSGGEHLFRRQGHEQDGPIR